VNGAHDMGGVHGFGPVVAETGEPVFHADWERRVLGLVVALGACGKWNIDMSRFARENRPPDEYLSLSYYELWLAGLERLLSDSGLLDQDASVRVLSAAEIPGVLAAGFPSERPAQRPPRFAVGDVVRTLNIHPQGHTRLPRYARGHVGEIERVHGCHVFPDHDAYGDEDPQWLYTVAFTGTELWGTDADPRSVVSFDAFEPYLEPV
jgi:nitrile hydratase beta subunit